MKALRLMREEVAAKGHAVATGLAEPAFALYNQTSSPLMCWPPLISVVSFKKEKRRKEADTSAKMPNRNQF